MNFKKTQVLLVDDNPHILSSLPAQLNPHFEKTTILDSPEHLTEVLKKETFDIVLLDMNVAFDENQGQEWLFWLRKIKREHPDTLVVLLTGMDGVDMALKGLEEGAADFLIKPWHPEKLIANLKLLLRLRMLEQKAEKHKKLLSRHRASDALNLEETEKHVIEKAVYVYQGNLSHAARQLGITRATLYAKMKKYNLSPEK